MHLTLYYRAGPTVSHVYFDFIRYVSSNNTRELDFELVDLVRKR